MKEILRNQEGMSLIELLLGVTVMGIIGSVVWLNIDSNQRAIYDSIARSELGKVKFAAAKCEHVYFSSLTSLEVTAKQDDRVIKCVNGVPVHVVPEGVAILFQEGLIEVSHYSGAVIFCLDKHGKFMFVVDSKEKCPVFLSSSVFTPPNMQPIFPPLVLPPSF